MSYVNIPEIPLSKVWEIYQIMKNRLAKEVFGRDADWRDNDWREKLYSQGGGEGLGTLQMILTAILSGGHVLLEDYPGSGKSFLASELSKCLEDDLLEKSQKKTEIKDYKRIQCVPDLLPSDILGYNKPAQHGDQPQFVPGPIFAHFLLLDEINRTTPKVQSAMLEAMAEERVTVEGEPHQLGPLFFVIATQNPLDKTGTYPLPGASLDRFLFKRTLSPISKEACVRIMLESGADGKERFKDWCDKKGIQQPSDKANKVYVDRKVLGTELVAAKNAIKTKVRLSNATVDALLRVDELIFESYEKPFADTGIRFEEGSRPSPRTLKRLAGALKVMAVIREGEKLQTQGLPDQEIARRLDAGGLETTPSLIKPVVADFLRHRVYPKAGSSVSGKSLELCLVGIAEEAIKSTL